MHIGPYDSEPETVTKMHEYMISEGYELDINEMRFHHEIYISDVRKTVPEKLKTVIRHPIKKNLKLDFSNAKIKFFMNWHYMFNIVL